MQQEYNHNVPKKKKKKKKKEGKEKRRKNTTIKNLHLLIFSRYLEFKYFLPFFNYQIP